ncbi:MAG TPA: ABC transporter permease [Gemmatimonadaceae bacterium]
MRAVLQDLRYALRRARSRAGFTAIAILSIGLGVGVNTAAFSLVNAIILRKTPIAQSDRVAELDMANERGITGPLSYADVKDLREQSDGVFSQIGLAKFSAFTRDLGDHVETLTGELVNRDFFPLIGLPPVLGRLLGPEDDVARGAHPVVVLGYDYWMSAFGGDRNVVGRKLRLSGREYTVVGVASRRIDGLLPGLAPSMYAPVMMVNQIEPTPVDDLGQRGNHSYFVRVRLSEGQSFAAARAVVDRFVARMHVEQPGHWPARLTIRLTPLSTIAVSPMLDDVIVPAVAALMVVVGLVLIIACANLASFLLAQARDRQREIAIRLAIGATRGALVRQLLVESLLIAFAGGVLGVALSSLALRGLLGADLPIPLPVSLDVSVDGRVLGFVLATSVVAGVLFGLLPALQATRPNVVDTIKNENAGGAPGGRRLSLRSWLVVAQTAASVVLLVTAALFLRSLSAQTKVDAGFGRQPAGIVWMAFPTDRYPAERRAQAIGELERRLRAMPGQSAVGVIDNIMLNPLSDESMTINIAGVQPPKGTMGFDIQNAVADSGFFEAAGLTLVNGRLFNSADVAGRERVVIVNQAMVDRFWRGQEALGQTFRTDSNVYRVVGVVKTTKIRSLGEAPRPMIFTAFTQDPSPVFFVVARARGNDALLVTEMLATIREMDPSLMIVQAKTMERHLAVMLLPARLGATAFAIFASLALVLATIGVYGVVRYAVARRGREVAIRMAIGADAAGVVRLLMREGLLLVVGGAVIGLVLSALTARGLQSLLFGVGTIDPIAFVGGPLLLIATGALAAFLPARRATRIDPTRALRAE